MKNGNLHSVQENLPERLSLGNLQLKGCTQKETKGDDHCLRVLVTGVVRGWGELGFTYGLLDPRDG